MKINKIILGLLVAEALFRPVRATAEGTWVPLANKPAEGIGTMILLPDGTVMAQGGGGGYASQNWYRLTPGSTGGYVNGVWTSRATMNYSRLYYSSDVLQNGKVFFAGAEAGNGSSTAELYDPVGDSWSILTVPAGLIGPSGFYDSGSILLSNGKVLVTPVYPFSYGGTVLFDPLSNTLSLGPTLYYGGDEDEAGMVKLPDDSILTVDTGSRNSERYDPSLNQWIGDATSLVTLYDPYGTELGPPVLLPNGKAFFIGSAPHTAIYTPSGSTSPGTWIAGPGLGGLGAPDAPAAMMFNGKVLCTLSPTPYTLMGTNYVFTTPSYFYEYDYSAGPLGTFTQIHAPNGSYSSSGPTWPTRMLDLPDGTVLFTDGGNQLYVYRPDGSPIASGKPTIYGASWNPDGSVHITGTLFNGISQGAVYGDDAQMDSNFPLVKFTDGGGNVYYGRTYNWSSTSVMTGGEIVTTECVVPAGVFYYNAGAFSLQVIANGIASDPVTFFGPVWVDFNYSGLPFQAGWFDYPFNTLAGGVGDVSSGGTIVIKSSNSAETMTISKPMTITSVYGPSTIGH